MPVFLRDCVAADRGGWATVAADMVRTNADETDGILVMTTKTLVINCSTSSDVPSDTVTW